MLSNVIQVVDTGLGALVPSRQTVETYLAGGVITAGDWVKFDATKSGADRVLYVIAAIGTGAVEGGDALVCGCALTSAATGQKVKVVVAGYHPTANVATGTAVGALYCDGTAAGRAVALVTLDDDLDAAPTPAVTGRLLGLCCGVSLAVAGGNVAPVVVRRF